MFNDRLEARIGVRPPPPPMKIKSVFLVIWAGGLSAPFFSMWGPVCYVFLPMGGGGGSFHYVSAFLLPFSPSRWPFFAHMGGGPFMGGRPCTLHILKYCM